MNLSIVIWKNAYFRFVNSIPSEFVKFPIEFTKSSDSTNLEGEILVFAGVEAGVLELIIPLLQ